MIITLPQVGESVTEGIIGKWLRSVGDSVERFDPLVEVVTDKVNMEMPSPFSGTLTAILAEEGETVPMGAPIAEMEVVGGPTQEGASNTSEAPSVGPADFTPDRIGTLLKDIAPVGPTGSGGPAVAPRPEATGTRRYSPAVLRLAEERGVDLDQVPGTGINGRVTVKDVRSYIESGQAERVEGDKAPADSSDEERVPLSPVRRIIAQNMVKSASQIPQAWTLVEVDVTGLVARRAAVRDEFQRREGINITYLPFVTKAVAESLKENPLLNSSWDGDAIVYKRPINIGIAAAAPDGLVVPVVHNADTYSVARLARKIDDLTTRARTGKLDLGDVQGGTFTLNNTGVLGSVLSQPLVNFPQAAILTTEAIIKRPVVIGDGIAIRSMMNLCMSFDHRVMDGAEASAFINSVKHRLESIDAETGLY